MTTGYIDFLNEGDFNRAFPRKLEQFMHQKWPASSVKVINLAMGGADEVTWLGSLDIVMEQEPDIVLVESAINDYCNYDQQEFKADWVHQKSLTLLNILMNFPTKPSVISVELFRTASGNKNDAKKHCPGHVQTTDTDPTCFYCPQWWGPQTWRKQARKRNSVSLASYRDAVWPIQDQPPSNLCQHYWTGLSHPEVGIHAMVASTILFQFLVV